MGNGNLPAALLASVIGQKSKYHTAYFDSKAPALMIDGKLRLLHLRALDANLQSVDAIIIVMSLPLHRWQRS